MNHSQAEEAKTKNIIDMAMSFSAMTRVFEKKAAIKIEKELEKILPQITSAKSKQDFDKCHRSFCQWFEGSIFTAERKNKNRTIKPSGHTSYGQGAKVLDVALKVYVHYCNLPSLEVADRIKKWLNPAVDTKMMGYLKDKAYAEASSIRATAISHVDENTYAVLQRLVYEDINGKFAGSILPVEWDDIMWRRLNKV